MYSKVEQALLTINGRHKLQYLPHEHCGVIEVDNFPMLGKAVAYRFVEWVHTNPDGVISLPTGRTPEHFIKNVHRILKGWDTSVVQEELREFGMLDSIRSNGPPDLSRLHFVQMDEFYPMNPEHHNSFCYYVRKYYIQGFGLDPNKALLMDTWRLGLPSGMNAGQLFHDGIRRLGGIGFFLGGIGPDGHVAFNIRGSDHLSTTRLCDLNYASQAAASSDLGGIEVSKARKVITIGLSTITFKTDCVPIIFAAGEAKAKIVGESIESERNNLKYPASALHCNPLTRFFLTHSAASRLKARKAMEVAHELDQWKQESHDYLPECIIRIVIDIAITANKAINELEQEDFRHGLQALELLSLFEKGVEITNILQRVRQILIERLERGLNQRFSSSFVHTAPHHDDIMLGYLPFATELIARPNSTHRFLYATSGFNAVTNEHTRMCISAALELLDNEDAQRAFGEDHFTSAQSGMDDDVSKFIEARISLDPAAERRAIGMRTLRIIYQVFSLTASCSHAEVANGFSDSSSVEDIVGWLKSKCNQILEYLSQRYSGQKDEPLYQQLKGMLREFEADLLWGYCGFKTKDVKHLRLGFYKGEVFTEEPKIKRDVLPILENLVESNPDVVTVALDPEGSGPDTHYKVLQAVSQAVRIYCQGSQENSALQGSCPQIESRKALRIWGYRNVWYKFHPAQATLFYPVSPSQLAASKDAFDSCFLSQRSASFPAPDYDGPFAELTQQTQAEQFRMMRTLMGQEFFEHHPDYRMRSARGLIFLHDLSVDEFLSHARSLHVATES